jgi:hypothetical protein
VNNTTFAIMRMDGRSNQQVVLDHVQGGHPGTVYTYSELGKALSDGTDRQYTERDVQAIVRQCAPRLSKEQARALTNVPTVGYKLALASEHSMLAIGHTRKAEAQLHRGVELLTHARFDEMDENQRRAHEGHLMITSALYQNQRLMWKKQCALEKAFKTAFASLTERVEAIAQVAAGHVATGAGE